MLLLSGWILNWLLQLLVLLLILSILFLPLVRCGYTFSSFCHFYSVLTLNYSFPILLSHYLFSNFSQLYFYLMSISPFSLCFTSFICPRCDKSNVAFCFIFSNFNLSMMLDFDISAFSLGSLLLSFPS